MVPVQSFFLLMLMQNDIRKDLGVCPQSDILFPELSVSISRNLVIVYLNTAYKCLFQADYPDRCKDVNSKSLSDLGTAG